MPLNLGTRSVLEAVRELIQRGLLEEQKREAASKGRMIEQGKSIRVMRAEFIGSWQSNPALNQVILFPQFLLVVAESVVAWQVHAPARSDVACSSGGGGWKMPAMAS